MLKGKAMIVLLAVGLDLSNYATKDLKNAVGVDTSGFVEKNDSVNLNSNVDKGGSRKTTPCLKLVRIMRET